MFAFLLVARVHILSTTAYSVFLFLHATLITFSFINLSQRTLIKFLFIRVTLTMLLYFPFFSILLCDTHVSILSILYSVYTLKYPLFCITILFTDDYSAFLFFQQAFIHRCHSFSWHFNPRVETLDGPDPLLMKSFVYRVPLFVRMSPISSVALWKVSSLTTL